MTIFIQIYINYKMLNFIKELIYYGWKTSDLFGCVGIFNELASVANLNL